MHPNKQGFSAPITRKLCSSQQLLRGLVFACCQSLTYTCMQSTKETAEHFNRMKRSCLSVVIGGLRSILFVSIFQGALAVAVIMIDDSKKLTVFIGTNKQRRHDTEKHNTN